jgi:hypothetical protein
MTTLHEARETPRPTNRSGTSRSDVSITALRRTNLGLAVIHAAQAAGILALSNSLSLPVTAAFGNGPPGQPDGPVELDTLFSYALGPAVALFLFLSAGFHLLVSTPWGAARYGAELHQEQNRFRWVEYSMSATLMIVLIAGLVGITDIAALLAIAGANIGMILFGWLMESTNDRRRRVSWTPFVFGCIVGVIPWIAISFYLVGAGSNVPRFVYVIFVTLFVLFNCFALNQWLQYRARGRWSDYLVGERTYMWLSLAAKSALAWQVFANVLLD